MSNQEKSSDKATPRPWKYDCSSPYRNYVSSFVILSDAKSRGLAFCGCRDSNQKAEVIHPDFFNGFSKEELERDFFNPEEMQANAELIVKAVNLYDALEAVAAHVKPMLDYIEMTMAHTGAMSVEQILSALEDVKNVAHIETAHHLGCPATSRGVDLNSARQALSTLNQIRNK